jgi:hypothetical protein
MTRHVPPSAVDDAAPDGYRTQAADTTYDIERRLVDAWRRMPSWEKARILRDACSALEQLSIAGCRARHAGASDEELWRQAAALRLGRPLMLEVYGWDPDASVG